MLDEGSDRGATFRGCAANRCDTSFPNSIKVHCGISDYGSTLKLMRSLIVAPLTARTASRK
jgi:hypothetical protein